MDEYGIYSLYRICWMGTYPMIDKYPRGSLLSNPCTNQDHQDMGFLMKYVCL